MLLHKKKIFGLLACCEGEKGFIIGESILLHIQQVKFSMD